MKKRILLFSFACLSILLLLTGCGDKKAIDTKKFKDTAIKYNYDLVDVTDQYSMYNNIKEATIMGNINDWQIEFYVLNSASDAIGMFNTNKEIFESYKGSNSLEYYTNMTNNNTYSLQSNGMYMYLCRVDNTLLYINVSEHYRDLVKSIADELGY